MIDQELVNELTEVLGDGIHRLIASFEVDAKQKLEALREAASIGQAAEARRLLHSLRGSSSNLGMLQLAMLCTELELTLPGRPLDLPGLEASVAGAVTAFRDHLRLTFPL